jgi:Lipase maturation factor
MVLRKRKKKSHKEVKSSSPSSSPLIREQSKETTAAEGAPKKEKEKQLPEKSGSTEDVLIVKSEHALTMKKVAAHQLPQFYTAKCAILRLMGCMYLVAFAAAWYQNEGLMGEHGLQPAAHHMERLHQTYENPANGFLQHPALFWWVPVTDFTMNAINLTGMLLSTLAVTGVRSWLLQFACWLLYFSVVTVAGGTSFYAYGWESQILETGFLCIFLCTLPLIDGNRIVQWSVYERVGNTAQSQPTAVILWLFQWLSFRISTGAGLIKVRGSSCWTAKTCLYYHFETQPIPSPLSFAYHFAPAVLQRRMVDTDLWVQLYTAWFVLFPACTGAWLHPRIERVVRFLVRLGGFLQAGFMVGILLSGNFSVLNHLTIIPALACLDDGCWPRFLQPKRHRRLEEQHPKSDDKKENATAAYVEEEETGVPLSRRVIDAMLLCLILSLSRPVIDNLLQRGGRRQQLMNASFDSFRLVNTYGAFGSVGKARYEVIIQISDDGEEWKEIEFPCKPGDLYRRPCFCAPYHYRLDWNIWFIGFKPHQSYLRSRETWLYILLRRLLENDNGDKIQRPWLDLLDRRSKEYLISTYYQAKKAPKYVKVDMYHYQMAAPLWTILRQKMVASLEFYDGEKVQQVAWWKRNFEEVLIPPISLESIQ